jgi:acyl-CoA synthetase (AMP-forming)/AMP-acid ligase II
VWAPNSLEWIVAALGVTTAGGVLVPVNTRFKGAEAAYILDRSGARALFTVRGFLDTDYPALLAAAGVALSALDRTILLAGAPANPDEVGWDDFLATGDVVPAAELDARIASIGPDDPSDVVFTSGTTGHPKGVVMAHGQTLRAYLDWCDWADLRTGDRYLIANPFFHIFGYKAGCLACLMRGATDIPVELIRRVREELPFERILTGYGLTEAGTVTGSKADDDFEHVATTVGVPWPGFEVRTVDPETGAPTAAGEPGEVAVRGETVMHAYLDDPAATAAAIDGDGWLHTGDLGVFDGDGYLRIVGRIKDMFIVGGFNAYPAEIENLLLRHPHVSQAAVIGVPDERLGEVGMAFVVAAPGAPAIGADALVEWSRGEMANYKVPRFVEVVDELPVNATGKVVKDELRARVARAEDRATEDG